MVALQLAIMVIFGIIFFQDYRERLVSWFLFPLMGVLAFTIQLLKTGIVSAAINASFNLAFALLMLLVCFLYSKWKLKKAFLSEVLGMGDILFFIFIAGTFSMTAFLVLFIFSLFFCLLLHTVVQHRQADKTVPLAGYMALFFGAVYLYDMVFNYPLLYTS